MRKTIDGRAFAEMILCASAALDENRQRLNELNVFPVPDGDTGTNMSLTMASAAAAMRERPLPEVGDAAERAAVALLPAALGKEGAAMERDRPFSRVLPAAGDDGIKNGGVGI